MADQLYKFGTVAIWDTHKGAGWIMFDDDSGAASVCQEDLRCATVSQGDRVEFNIRIKQNGSKKAIHVKPWNQYNTNKAPAKDKQEATTGILYFQTAFFDAKQMQNIDNKFRMNIKKGPKILFGDNCSDKLRNNYSKRQRFGGQSKIMGHWDRKYGFGIPTVYSNAKSVGFIYNDHNFRQLMKKLFKELKLHLANGGDIIIPYPSKKDLSERKHKYFKKGWGNKGKQLIFHNLGTGISSLSFDHLLVIQQNIDELKQLAIETKIIHQVLYNKNEKHQPTYHEKFIDKNNKMDNQKTLTVPKSSRGSLIFQTDWYNRQQMEHIYNYYSKQNALQKAPKMVFGDNDIDKTRPLSKSRQFWGGMAGVMGKYDRSISFGIVTTFFEMKTPNINNFRRGMDRQFKDLGTHLLNGGDIVIPKPSENNIRKNSHRYCKNGKQIIFHNLGTGIASLSFDYIHYIQTKIDELQKIAKKTLTVKYYKSNYSSQLQNEEKSSVYFKSNNTHTTVGTNENKMSDEKIAKEMHQKFEQSKQIMKQPDKDNIEQLQKRNQDLETQLSGSQKELETIKMKLNELKPDDSMKLMQQNNNDKYEQLQKTNGDLEQKLLEAQNELKTVNSKFEEQKMTMHKLQMECENLKSDGIVNEQNNDKVEQIERKNRDFQQQLIATKNEMTTTKLNFEKQLTANMDELKNVKLKFEGQKKHSQMLEIKNEKLKTENKEYETQLNDMKLKFRKQQQELQRFQKPNTFLRMNKENIENKKQSNGDQYDHDEDSDLEQTKNTKNGGGHAQEITGDYQLVNVKQNNPTYDSMTNNGNDPSKYDTYQCQM